MEYLDIEDLFPNVPSNKLCMTIGEARKVLNPKYTIWVVKGGKSLIFRELQTNRIIGMLKIKKCDK